MGSKHRRRATLSPSRDASGLAHRALKSIGEVSELLEETIRRVRQGPFDSGGKRHWAIASTPLKALDQRLEARIGHLEAVISRTGETESEAFEFDRQRRRNMNSRQRRVRAIELSLTAQRVVLVWLRNALTSRDLRGASAANATAPRGRRERCAHCRAK
jgi:hypothetical protein